MQRSECTQQSAGKLRPVWDVTCRAAPSLLRVKRVISRRHRALPRAAKLAVAAVVLLCQATAWVHAAATPHVTCLEHGESVHMEPGAGSHDAGRLALSTPRPESATHSHEHCGLQGQRTISATAPTRIHARVSFAVATGPAPAAIPLALRLLCLAPKTSPPRAPAA
jgi:hypothetical protein